MKVTDLQSPLSRPNAAKVTALCLPALPLNHHVKQEEVRIDTSFDATAAQWGNLRLLAATAMNALQVPEMKWWTYSIWICLNSHTSPPVMWRLLDFMSATPSPHPSRPPPPPASSRWQCSHPDLNCKLRMAVFPTGPQPQQPRAPDGSVPIRTSTESSRRQCSHPDLNCESPTAMFPHTPQPRAPNGSVPTRTSAAGSGRQCSPHTSTASSRWQCSPPDFNRKLPTAAFPTGPQLFRTYVR